MPSLAPALRIASLSLTLVLAVALTGCVTPAPPAPATSHTATASSPAPAVQAPDCAQLLPADVAATALGLPADSLSEGTTDSSSGTNGTQGATGAAFADAARASSGLLDCRWTTSLGTEDGPAVRLSVLPNSADQFQLVEPDSNDGLSGLETIDIGDIGYISCHGGEGKGCRVEALAGANWMSINVTPQFSDPAPATELARSLVAKVAMIPPTTSMPAAIDCTTVLDPSNLASAGVTDPTLRTDRTINPRSSIWSVAALTAGYASCSWGRGEADAPGIVSIDALSSAANPTRSPTGGSNSSIPLEPIPDVGDSAVGGCTANYCELAVLGSGVWLMLSTVDPTHTGIDQLATLARVALTNAAE